MSKLAKKGKRNPTTTQEKKKKTVPMSQNSSQQRKPNYCMCVLPLPSLWLVGIASVDKREYSIVLPNLKQTTTTKKKHFGKCVLLQDANAIK